MRRQVLTLVFLNGWAVTICEAIPFQNLDFRQATTNKRINGKEYINNVTPGVSYTDMPPGWELTLPGRTNVFTFGFNILNPLEALLDFVTLNTDYVGAFGLRLFPQFAQFQLKQTGEIPADAKSLRFATGGLFFELKLDEFVVPLSYDPLLFTFGAAQTITPQ